MAPRKRKAEGEEVAAAVKTDAMSTRVTRSVTRQVNANSSDSLPDLPKKKKGKTVGEKKKKKKKGEKTKEEEEEKIVEPKEKEENAETEAKIETENLEDKETEKEEAEEELVGDGHNKTIIVEHCKQCNSFKTRAMLVKNGLENAVPHVTVLLNPDKPRRGCFEIREEGGEKFISLLDMKRPFQPMKALDMDEVIRDIIDKIK